MQLTRGIKHWGVKWLIERSTSHQGLVSGDTDVAPKSPTFHTADRQTAQKPFTYSY
jgi:hypothetical protein